MTALDQPRIDNDPAHHVARREELTQARDKLLALVDALASLVVRYRLAETAQERIALLRVWDDHRELPAETVAVVQLPEAWRFTSYPHGPVLADGDGIKEDQGARRRAGNCPQHRSLRRQEPMGPMASGSVATGQAADELGAPWLIRSSPDMSCSASSWRRRSRHRCGRFRGTCSRRVFRSRWPMGTTR